MNVIFLDEEYFPIIIKPDRIYPPSIRVEVKLFYITVYRNDNITEIVNILTDFNKLLIFFIFISRMAITTKDMMRLKKEYSNLTI